MRSSTRADLVCAVCVTENHPRFHPRLRPALRAASYGPSVQAACEGCGGCASFERVGWSRSGIPHDEAARAHDAFRRRGGPLGRLRRERSKVRGPGGVDPCRQSAASIVDRHGREACRCYRYCGRRRHGYTHGVGAGAGRGSLRRQRRLQLRHLQCRHRPVLTPRGSGHAGWRSLRPKQRMSLGDLQPGHPSMQPARWWRETACTGRRGVRGGRRLQLGPV